MPSRPVLGLETVLLLAAVAFAAFYNGSLWRLLFAGSDAAPGPALVTGLFIAVVCVQFAGLALLVPRTLAKPVLSILFLATALASYYMDRYGILIDKEMVRNVVHTDPAEAAELLTPALLPHLLLYLMLPVALLAWVRIEPLRLGRSLVVRGRAVAIALSIAVVLVATEDRKSVV